MKHVLCIKDIYSRWSDSSSTIGERDVLEFKEGEIYETRMLSEQEYVSSKEGYIKPITSEYFIDYDSVLVDDKIGKLLE